MYQRLKDIVNVRYAVRDRDKQKNESIPRDICGGGIGLCLPEKLRQGAILELEITCPDNPQQTIHGTGKVLWTRPFGVVEREQSVILYQTGIGFLDINPIAIGKIYTYSRQTQQ